MLVTVNGHAVLSAKVRMTLRGAWTFVGNVDAAGGAVPGSPALLEAPGLSLPASVWRTGFFRGSAATTLVGGNGGLGEAVVPQSFRIAPLRLILAAILEAGGETLSPTSDAAILERLVGRWSVAAGPVATALELLAEDQGFSWRVVDDGGIWVGVETWPKSPVDGLLDVPDLDESSGRMTAAIADRCGLRPGTTYGGRKIVAVEYEFSAADARAEVEFA